jgi:uncharacterized protein
MTRVKVKGGGTFEVIYDNLIALRQSKMDFLIALRVHVTGSNCKAIPDFIGKLNSDFGGDARFGLHIVPVESYNTGDSRSFDDCAEPQLYQSTIKESFARAVDLQILNPPGSSCEVCYAARANSFAIRSDGFVMKCTVGVDNEKNIVGKLTSDGTLSVDPIKLRPWMTGFFTGNKAQLACPQSQMPHK